MSLVEKTSNSSQFFVQHRFECHTETSPYLGPNDSFLHGNWSVIFRDLNFQAKACSLGQVYRCVNSATSNGEVAQACDLFRHGRFDANRTKPHREIHIDPMKIPLWEMCGASPKSQVPMRTELTADGIDGEKT